VFFGLDTAVLDAAQTLCIALPAAGVPALLLRLGGRGWTLVAVAQPSTSSTSWWNRCREQCRPPSC
jgi:hypothetical protein